MMDDYTHYCAGVSAEHPQDTPQPPAGGYPHSTGFEPVGGYTHPGQPAPTAPGFWRSVLAALRLMPDEVRPKRDDDDTVIIDR